MQKTKEDNTKKLANARADVGVYIAKLSGLTNALEIKLDLYSEIKAIPKEEIKTLVSAIYSVSIHLEDAFKRLETVTK